MRNNPSSRVRRGPAWLRAFGALFALAAGVAGYTKVAPLLGPRLKAGPQVVEVAKLSDGDTLHVRLPGGDEDIKLRLIGIDCPELGSADGFLAATATSLLCDDAARLELELERAQDGSIKRDKYGRMLAWLWVTPGPDWPRQRQWVEAYPLLGTKDAGIGGFMRRSREPKVSAREQPILLQEELLRLGCAELYPAAQGSKYYSRLVAADK